jgi:hypothetical protein
MTEIVKTARAVVRALTINQEMLPGGGIMATTFRYYADKSIVCELRLPTNTQGMISPDGTLMLLTYLKRLVKGYDSAPQ